MRSSNSAHPVISNLSMIKVNTQEYVPRTPLPTLAATLPLCLQELDKDLTIK